jgi:hypothetical protein
MSKTYLLGLRKFVSLFLLFINKYLDLLALITVTQLL